jgi:hypothetical protein
MTEKITLPFYRDGEERKGRCGCRTWLGGHLGSGKFDMRIRPERRAANGRDHSPNERTRLLFE